MSERKARNAAMLEALREVSVLPKRITSLVYDETSNTIYTAPLVNPWETGKCLLVLANHYPQEGWRLGLGGQNVVELSRVASHVVGKGHTPEQVQTN